MNGSIMTGLAMAHPDLPAGVHWIHEAQNMIAFEAPLTLRVPLSYHPLPGAADANLDFGELVEADGETLERFGRATYSLELLTLVRMAYPWVRWAPKELPFEWPKGSRSIAAVPALFGFVGDDLVAIVAPMASDVWTPLDGGAS